MATPILGRMAMRGVPAAYTTALPVGRVESVDDTNVIVAMNDGTSVTVALATYSSIWYDIFTNFAFVPFPGWAGGILAVTFDGFVGYVYMTALWTVSRDPDTQATWPFDRITAGATLALIAEGVWLATPTKQGGTSGNIATVQQSTAGLPFQAVVADNIVQTHREFTFLDQGGIGLAYSGEAGTPPATEVVHAIESTPPVFEPAPRSE